MPSMVDEDGGYRPDSGGFDDLKPKVEGSISFNPKTVKGLENYRPGDTVNLKVKVMWPKDATGEEGGVIEPEIVSLEAEDMEDGARVTRMREKAAPAY